MRFNAFARFVIVPLVIALVVAFCGMFLPITMYGKPFELHNVVWEFIFGIGFYAAAFVSNVFSFEYTSRPVALVGMGLWPLFVMVIVFLTSRRVLRSSRNARLIWGAAFVLSLLVCVGHDAENYLALHGVHVFWTYSAVCY
jgi:drug/metabolite transporter (DMT)-like permease